MILGLSAALAWEVDAAVGAEVNATPSGIVNVSARSGPWRLSLLTDTVEVRYERSTDHGRSWGALRAEFGAAGIVHNRWLDGAPAPTASQLGFYAGPEGGSIRYLGNGWYAGLQGHARGYTWVAQEQTLSVIPSRAVVRAEAVLGWWSETVDLYAAAGATGGIDTASPGAEVTLRLRPDGVVRPWVELRAGTRANGDVVTATRVGGLNPYVVPLAGAAWAEFWVENYVAVRAAVRVRAAQHWVAPLVDAVSFDGRSEAGLGLMAHTGAGRFTVDAGVGVAPYLQRQSGIAASAFLLLSASTRRAQR